MSQHPQKNEEAPRKSRSMFKNVFLVSLHFTKNMSIEDLNQVWTTVRRLQDDMKEALDPAPLRGQCEELVERLCAVKESDVISVKCALQFTLYMLRSGHEGHVSSAARMVQKILGDVKKSESKKGAGGTKRPRPYSSDATFPQPVGRPRKDHTWDEKTGTWVFDHSLASFVSGGLVASQLMERIQQLICVDTQFKTTVQEILSRKNATATEKMAEIRDAFDARAEVNQSESHDEKQEDK